MSPRNLQKWVFYAEIHWKTLISEFQNFVFLIFQKKEEHKTKNNQISEWDEWYAELHAISKIAMRCKLKIADFLVSGNSTMIMAYLWGVVIDTASLWDMVSQFNW